MSNLGFYERIKMLQSNISDLIDYLVLTGYEGDLLVAALAQLNKDLVDKDPFVVFSATLQAEQVINDKTFYH